MPNTRVCRLIIILLIASTAIPATAIPNPNDNMVAQTPPMGWNSWNRFACDVSESLIKSIADAMVSSGLKDAGYEYVVIDDCWQVNRDAAGNIVADPDRFPSGIKSLARLRSFQRSEVRNLFRRRHQHMRGPPGKPRPRISRRAPIRSLGRRLLEIRLVQHWHTNDAQAAYKTMSDALKSTGRPIVFSLCEWGDHKPWLWGKDVGNLWRTTGDITDCWDCKNGLSSDWF